MAEQQAVPPATTDCVSRAIRLLHEFGHDTRGATAIEYAMMASLIGAAIAATVWNIGSAVKANWYDKIASIFS